MNTALSTTTTKVTVFQNRQFGEVRTIMRNGEPWFVAADVCRALEINNSRDAVTRLEDDERDTVVLTDGIRGNPNVTVVNRPGLFSLVLGSRKPEARLFKHWITHEVLPALEKHGVYAINQLLDNPDLLIASLQKLKAERERANHVQMAALETCADIHISQGYGGQRLSIGSIAPGDILTVNSSDYTVRNNGAAVEKTGFFPYAQGGISRHNIQSDGAMRLLFDYQERNGGVGA